MSDLKPAFNPKFKRPEDAARLSQLEASIRKIEGNINAIEERVGKLTKDSIFKARQIGLVLNEIADLLWGQFKRWAESDRFDGSYSTAKGYRRLTDEKEWRKVLEKWRTEGCTYKQAMQIVRKEAQPKTVTRKQRLEKKLVQKFAKLIRGWPESALARLVGDIKFMKRIEQLAKERDRLTVLAIKDQMLDAA